MKERLKKKTDSSYLSALYETTEDELRALFGLWIHLGRGNRHFSNVESIWSTNPNDLSLGIFLYFVI